jgi:hypothetical protein
METCSSKILAIIYWLDIGLHQDLEITTDLYLQVFSLCEPSSAHYLYSEVAGFMEPSLRHFICLEVTVLNILSFCYICFYKCPFSESLRFGIFCTLFAICLVLFNALQP